MKILFADSEIIAIDKPSGVLVIPDRWKKEKGESLIELLQKKTNQKIFVVNRLDRDTSGVVLFVKNEIVHRTLSMAFERREVEKVYYGLVHGNPPKSQMEIHRAIDICRNDPTLMIVHDRGRQSTTCIEVLDSFYEYSWLKIIPKTARTHQVRVHLASIGCPLVCDRLYGLSNDEIYLSKLKKRYLFKAGILEKPLLTTLALHAHELTFCHPTTKEVMTIHSPLRKDLKATIHQMKKLAR